MCTLSEDHEGRRFKSLADMCRHWNVSYQTVWCRLERGWSIQAVLTGDCEKKLHPRRGTKCHDHENREYASIAALCRKWNMKPYVFYNRKKAGWSLREILDTPVGEGREK